MKKSVFIALLALLAVGPAYAGMAKTETPFDATLIAGTNSTVVSRVFNVNGVSSMGYWIDPASGSSVGSSVRLNIVMQGSPDETSANFATTNAIQQAIITPFATAGTISVPNIKFVRFVAQGNTGNATDTTLTMKFYTRE